MSKNYESEDEEIEDLMLTKKEKKELRRQSREQKEREKEKINPQLNKIIEKRERAQKTLEMNKKSHESQEIVSFKDNEVSTSNNTPDLVKPKESNEAGRVIQNQVSRPPMDESGDVDLNKLFSSEVGNDSDVVKELFSSENIKVKTELTQEEISIISRLELQASMTQNFFLAKVIKELETLRVSKDRKSRSEFVSSFGGIKESQNGMTAFGKLGSIFKNDKV